MLKTLRNSRHTGLAGQIGRLGSVAVTGLIPVLTAVLLLSTTVSVAHAEEGPVELVQAGQPAHLTPEDQGSPEDIVPVSILKGQVTRQTGRYILGPGDILEMKIQDLKQYDQEFSIRPDGYASIHPFGEYHIAGSDLNGLERWLEEKFRHYLVKPQVTLSVRELRPALIYVSGAVRRPGVYQFIRQGQNNSTIHSELQEKVELTLNNVLKKAGGLTLFADVTHVRVTHAATGVEEDCNLMDLLLAGKATDIWLMPGDTIMVPTMDLPMDPEVFKLISQSTFFEGKFPVVVLGAVEKQGEVAVDPTNSTLNAAIGLAGGFAHYSKEGKILVQRPTNNGGFSQLQVAREKVNFQVLPGDVVYVSDSKLSPMRDGFQMLGLFTQPFFFTTSGLNSLKNLGN